MVMRSFSRKLNLSVAKNSHNAQYLLSFAVGWFVMGGIFNEQMEQAFTISKNSRSMSQCFCKQTLDDCVPCEDHIVDQKLLQQQNAEVAKGYYRSYRFKPQSSAEGATSRWRYLTPKHNYEMINQEPRIGLNGMWREEVTSVDKVARALVHNHDSNDQKTTGKLSMSGMFRSTDPFHGVTYLVNLEEAGKPEEKRHTVVEMWKPYMAGKPKLIDIQHATGEEMINIISPMSKVTERFNLFLDRYERHVIGSDGKRSGPVRIIFVIFEPNDEQKTKKDESVAIAVDVLNRFKARNPNAAIEYIFTKGEFNRAVGLHTGILQCKNDEIMLFLDVDLKIGPDFLSRVRRNTVRGGRVIFPIMYSQYDPEIMDKAAETNPTIRPFVVDKMAINKHTGFWIYYAYGVAAMYKSDYLKVGGFRLDIRGWGGEDVDLFKKMVADPNLEVMSTVDPDLIHIYHQRGCDVSLAADQYAMCVGAWAETLGSKLQVASLYIASHKDT